MKPIHLLSAAALALTFATQAAGAASPDPSGKADLGIDISQVGTNSADHQTFIGSLSADQQASLRKKCLVIVSQPTSYAPNVVAFCQSVNAMPATAMAAPASDAMAIAIPQDAALSYNLIGLDVYNANNDSVGEIKDLILQKDKVIGYVISVGGFLGMGEHYVAISPSAIAITYDQSKEKWLALMNATKDQLKQAPEFKYDGKFKR